MRGFFLGMIGFKWVCSLDSEWILPVGIVSVLKLLELVVV